MERLVPGEPVMFKMAKPNSKGISKVSTWACWREGADVVSLSGYECGKKRESRYTAIATNVGRSNERNPEEQAAFEVGTAYKAQFENKHYRWTVEDAQEHQDNCKVPMKLTNFKNHEEKIIYPCYVQRKFNGSRLTVMDSDFISKAGRVEEFKVEHIRDSALALATNFDSEVYCHGFSLQRIQAARLKPNEDTEHLKIVIFDIPLLRIPFAKRASLLRKLARHIRRSNHTHVEVELPLLVQNRDQLIAFYNDALEDGYEGIVARNSEGIFEFGNRSYDTQKLKPRYQAEALVLSVTKDKNGNGKLHVQSSDKLGNVKFKCMMKVKRSDGKDHPRDFETMQKLIGNWITFSYEELSDTGVPTKPVGELERECDDAGIPLMH